MCTTLKRKIDMMETDNIGQTCGNWEQKCEGIDGNSLDTTLGILLSPSALDQLDHGDM